MSRVERTVVSDSTPLIHLAKTGKLNIIRDLFGKVFIPKGVYDEVVTRGKALNISDSYIIEKQIGIWITRMAVTPEFDSRYSFLDSNTRLGSGEKEAIKLCEQLKAEYLIADDREARRVSKMLNVKPLGTCALIVQASRQGLIEKNEALQILDDLTKAGFRIGAALYRRMLDELRLL